jgi:hypothetical protein
MKDNSDELTPEEQSAFAALPRETDPGGLLEERTVNALHARGLLRAGPERTVSRRVPMWALGLAASLALFVSGVATGQWLGTRTLAGSMAAAQQETAMQTASLVQQTGSAYVMALMSLAQLADSSSDPAVAQGREAALTSLHAAARELALLAPEDPLTLVLRDGLRLTSLQGAVETSGTNLQSVVWF